ncbi:hypothetical protein BASA50_003155 [Batrachochytrium salamandrivorans]|uniref:Uncharacterized protein n=1 Tax=Batrachochytrium salamandrivorans TaxID=1357716 RepID=A0ABQ8FJC4_9FUNG|nr:hypothetical protein BASA62_008047 [Batrachochytrium salamandrivorans]KAH6593049.1 hypothetical protein BASA61_004385 [Batrachochytrium salamandrivorans]KAH6599269.1 hypothetical protein BASA50_003155 [Batrachochytrium salamandrivorans]KAJ1341200.1 hypothetical protein BSLG_004205 [Batrachochytrium salamandrivorans]
MKFNAPALVLLLFGTAYSLTIPAEYSRHVLAYSDMARRSLNDAAVWNLIGKRDDASTVDYTNTDNESDDGDANDNESDDDDANDNGSTDDDAGDSESDDDDTNDNGSDDDDASDNGSTEDTPTNDDSTEDTPIILYGETIGKKMPYDGPADDISMLY